MHFDSISIGITCFNAETTIERAIRSAQGQAWPRVQIVVVDDCSSDGSWSVIETLSAKDARIRPVRHAANRGVGAARNSILEHATGEFVAFFDDDDTSAPERIALQHTRIVEYERATNARLVLCFSGSTDEYPDGARQYSPCLGMDATPAPSGDEVARLILLGQPASGSRGVCPTATLMARRTVFQAGEGFDPMLRRHEDTDFNLRAALQGAHFAGMSSPLVTRTVTGTSDKTIAHERRHALELIDKHREVLERWGWYDFARSWCDVKFARLEGGTTRALPLLMRLGLRWPLKTARKVAWSLPNRSRYARYRHAHAPGT